MEKRNPRNEQIKHVYFNFLIHADRKSDKTIRQVEKSILRYEDFTHFADLGNFDQKQAIDFKNFLSKQKLSKATILSDINRLKRFLSWLATQPGYKSQIKLNDVEYLNLSEKDVRAASAPIDRPFPTLKMIEKVVSQMPHGSAIEKRDRALIAFVALTGIRVGALITLKLKHFDTKKLVVRQDPLEVSTKFSKRIDTFLFPLNNSFEKIVLEWVSFLRQELLFADHYPLFPKTKMGHDKNDCFVADGLTRTHWENTSPPRKIFRSAFEAAGLSNYNPHSFRHTLVAYLFSLNLDIAEFKAASQNLGHENVQTTLTSYGKLSLQEQGDLVRGIRHQDIDDNQLGEILRLLKEQKPSSN